MDTITHADTDPLTIVRSLTLADIERRIAALEGERALLGRLRRSLAARERAIRRAAARLPSLADQEAPPDAS